MITGFGMMTYESNYNASRGLNLILYLALPTHLINFKVWCNQEPKMCRYRCDSFVLSLRFDDADLFCGLNNGSIQLWDLNFNILKREQESHDKGVKV